VNAFGNYSYHCALNCAERNPVHKMQCFLIRKEVVRIVTTLKACTRKEVRLVDKIM
jgi:hypothetical protein